MPAKSKQQKKFFSLVRAVQAGKVPAHKVTSNVRQAAKDVSTQDVKDFASTEDGSLPSKVNKTEKQPGDKTDEATTPSDPEARERILAKRMKDRGDSSIYATPKKNEAVITHKKVTTQPNPHRAGGPQYNDKKWQAQNRGTMDRMKANMSPGKPVSYQDEAKFKRPTSTTEYPKSAGPDGGDWSSTPKGSHTTYPEVPNVSPEYNARRQDAIRMGKSDANNEVASPASFADTLQEYRALGETLNAPNRFMELAERLAAISEYAEQTLTNELADDWYDAHTIKRNVNEMKKYAADFGKIAHEADQHNQRMKAYYEDMGRILERYVEVYDHRPNKAPTSQPPVNTQPSETNVDRRVVNNYREGLSESTLTKFDYLPEYLQIAVAWRALRKGY